MIYRATLLLAAILALPTGAHAQASADLRCVAAALDMAKMAAGTENKYAFLPVQAFYLGRLSVIEPKTDWLMVAASERHVSFPEARPILQSCRDRMGQLTHVSEK
ncbi:MAG: hypothetical protein ACRYG4_09240 [Janthinobacterium lividum]